jgi:uracil-DNA glycosylase family 4
MKQQSASLESTKAKAALLRLAARIRTCTKCPLHASRTVAVPGKGKPSAAVVLIGEGPGREEDRTGQPFAGRLLNRVLRATGFERKDLFITNLVKCRPPNNRLPKRAEIDTCTQHYLFKQIELVNPRFIVLLGSAAAAKLLGRKCLGQARGNIFECNGRKYLVAYHPAARPFRVDVHAKIKEDFRRLRRELDKE